MTAEAGSGADPFLGGRLRLHQPPRGAHRAEAVFAAFIDHLALGRLDVLAVDYEQFETRDATLALLMHGFAPVVGAPDHTL
ncbi:hypothetical protein ACLBYE_26790, partial [Methylobacterium sp. A52T]